MNNRKTINKETQDAIKKFLMSNVSSHALSPSSPTIGLDPQFSQILQKKREEQLEASRRLFESTVSKCDETLTKDNEKKCDSMGAVPVRKCNAMDFENSMMFTKANKSWNDLSEGEDSFLALERECNMADKRQNLMNANDTLLFDIEPPSEFFDQTVNQTLAVGPLNTTQDEEEPEDGDETIEISPVKYIGLIRPSTIIEETSSQFDSSSKNVSSSATTSSFYETASFNNSAKAVSFKSCDISQETEKFRNDSVSSSHSQQNSFNKTDRQRRGTFAFKRANYTFFPNENMEPIHESESFSEDIVETPFKKRIVNIDTTSKSETPVTVLKSVETETNILKNERVETPPAKLVDIETPEKVREDDEDQFNNTLERVDYLLEKGKRMLEETPVAKRTNLHNSMLETPLFSCKRKRLLTEMAAIEMQPLPKRGPLIDFSTPEPSKQTRFSRFDDK